MQKNKTKILIDYKFPKIILVIIHSDLGTWPIYARDILIYTDYTQQQQLENIELSLPGFYSIWELISASLHHLFSHRHSHQSTLRPNCVCIASSATLYLAITDPVQFIFTFLRCALSAGELHLSPPSHLEQSHREKKNTQRRETEGVRVRWACALAERGVQVQRLWYLNNPPTPCSVKNNQPFIWLTRQTGALREYYLSGVCSTNRQAERTLIGIEIHTHQQTPTDKETASIRGTWREDITLRGGVFVTPMGLAVLASEVVHSATGSFNFFMFSPLEQVVFLSCLNKMWQL